VIGLSAPLEGLSRAQASFDSAAAKIAQPISLDSPNPQDQVSLSDQMVALMQSRNDYEANLKSLQTSNQMQKTLLDLIG
jgi:flagellar basal body rod protein FlgG